MTRFRNVLIKLALQAPVIARSQVHIARSQGVTFIRTTFVFTGEKFGSHLVVDGN